MKSIIPAVLLLAALAGCSREDIEVYRVPKEARAPALMALSSSPGMELPPGHPELEPGALPPGSAGASAGEAGELHWHAPSAWKEKPASSMRLGSYSIAGPGAEADMSIVTLAGDAGGVLANIERWRGQLGLEPLGGEKALAANSTKVRTRAGEVVVVDFAGAGGKRLLGGILKHGESSWFFKMTGPAAVVGGAKPGFLELLGSLHPALGHE